MSLAPSDFRFIADLVRGQTAIVLEPGKEYLVEARLGPVATQAGLGDIATLVRALRSNPDATLLQSVVEAMTTNETSFYRDIKPFDHLKNHVLPRLIERRQRDKSLSIWSAASSSGQEPYSIAMLLREHFPQLLKWNVKILATDISRKMLNRASRGLYTQLEVNRGLPAPFLIRYFRKSGIEYQIDDSLRKAVEWRQFNLSAPTWRGVGPFDIVLLRNVMIYFDVETKRRILGNTRAVLRSDGYLFLGTAETTLNLDDGYGSDLLNASCYRLKAA